MVYIKKRNDRTATGEFVFRENIGKHLLDHFGLCFVSRCDGTREQARPEYKTLNVFLLGLSDFFTTSVQPWHEPLHTHYIHGDLFFSDWINCGGEIKRPNQHSNGERLLDGSAR